MAASRALIGPWQADSHLNPDVKYLPYSYPPVILVDNPFMRKAGKISLVFR